MTDKELPSPELLRKLLRYEPDTGKLFWLPRPVEMFTTVGAGRAWNSKLAGRQAFTAKHNAGYHMGRVFGVGLLAHRVAWALHYGEWPQNDIDHINGNRKDNRLSNLRDVSRSANSRNASKSPKNTSGYNGVYWYKRGRKWKAQISMNGNVRHLGTFDNISDAVAARRAAEVGHGFTKRHGT